MLINLSNHPWKTWKEAQVRAAKQYGEIVDMEFPEIPPEWTTERVAQCALENFEKCKIKIGNTKDFSAIHVAGEPVFCFLLVQLLLTSGYTCLTSTTSRNVKVEGDEKISSFNFNCFREFKLINIYGTEK